MTTCVVCGERIPGWPDTDVTCVPCEALNFRGDALRHPPRREAHVESWWEEARGPLAARRLRQMRDAEEVPDGH
jgi:hypothetical protein